MLVFLLSLVISAQPGFNPRVTELLGKMTVEEKARQVTDQTYMQSQNPLKPSDSPLFYRLSSAFQPSVLIHMRSPLLLPDIFRTADMLTFLLPSPQPRSHLTAYYCVVGHLQSCRHVDERCGGYCESSFHDWQPVIWAWCAARFLPVPGDCKRCDEGFTQRIKVESK